MLGLSRQRAGEARACLDYPYLFQLQSCLIWTITMNSYHVRLLLFESTTWNGDAPPTGEKRVTLEATTAHPYLTF